MLERGLPAGMLSPYRVLDLTDEKGLLCGKLLGDLGADVIKVERPGGDRSRSIGPFYHDEVHPERSLFWWAFNTSKRGITLDIETSEGRETFERLVGTADLVIESFPPGYMDRLGLGYQALEEINPGIVLVSITPFGQTGPYRDYKAPDIVAWAMGGQSHPCGDPDRPPVRISHHSQAYLHAAAEAASGAMMALYHREISGEGQHVDVSIQECLAQATYVLTATWDMMKVIRQRTPGSSRVVRMTRIWPCKDGYVFWIFFGGAVAKRWNLPLIRWMEEEGMADDFLREFNWDSFDLKTTTQETVDAIGERARRFLMTHTTAELLEGAVKRKAMLYPVFTVADIRHSAQLAARKYWVNVPHPELGTNITYPGAFALSTEAPPRIWRRAPLIGEHNQEVYEELKLAEERVTATTRARSNRVKLDIMKTGNPPGRLLDGIKVADFTWNAAAPIAIKTLCDHGAEVIKMESRSHPDLQRTLGAFKDGVPGENRSGDWNRWNTGKLSVGLNLTHPRGVEIAKKFIARADIVAENFAGGVMEKLGLGYEELKKVKPDIIMLSSCMQGQTGPHAILPGFGNHLTALSGFVHITGWPDREPFPPDGPYTDFIAPRFTLLIIMAALDYRRRTGKGQYIDLSQYESVVHFMAPLILDYEVNGRVAGREGNHHPCAAPHNAYRCRGEDRWCAIAVFGDEEWRTFGNVIGNPAWVNSPKFSTLQARKENEEELDRLVEGWTINHPAEDVMTMMQAAGVAAGLLENGEDLLERDPQLKHRASFWALDHPEVGIHRVAGPSFVLSKCPYGLQRAPLLGEHNEYALKNILGMSDEEIAALVIDGVLQ